MLRPLNYRSRWVTRLCPCRSGRFVLLRRQVAELPAQWRGFLLDLRAAFDGIKPAAKLTRIRSENAITGRLRKLEMALASES